MVILKKFGLHLKNFHFMHLLSVVRYFKALLDAIKLVFALGE